jgi:ankyrin repeat protein
LKNGAQVNNTNADGTTSLMFASGRGHVSVCELLLENGAQVDIRDKSGWTSLMFASWRGHVSVCELLLENGAQAHGADNDDETCLTKATMSGDACLCQFLLAHGAQIDEKMNIQLLSSSVGAVLLPHTKAFKKAIKYTQIEAIVDQVFLPPGVVLGLISSYLGLHIPKAFRSMTLTSNLAVRLNDVQLKHAQLQEENSIAATEVYTNGDGITAS